MHFFFRNDTLSIFLILFFSILLRVFYLIFFENLTEPFIQDSAAYYEIAQYVNKNGILNWKYHDRPPLISIVIMPIIKIFNFNLSIIYIKFLMILFSVLTCVALYFLAKEITKNNKISLLISLVYCFYPLSIFFSGKLLTENLASLLICLISFFFLKYIKKFDLKFLITSSFLMGLLSLTRSSYYYLPFILCFVILLTNTKILKKALSIFIIIITFFLTLSPWIVKNYFQLNEFVPTTTRLGYGLWLSNNDFSSEVIKKGGYERTEKFKRENMYSKELDPIKRSNYLKKKAINEILNNKTEFLKACIFRFLNFFNPKPNPYKKFENRDFIMIIFYSPFLLILLFSIMRKKHSLEKKILLTIIFYTLFVHMPFFGFPRFRFPIDSLIFLIGLTFLAEKKLLNYIKIFTDENKKY